jgi:hypothetical protein
VILDEIEEVIGIWPLLLLSFTELLLLLILYFLEFKLEEEPEPEFFFNLEVGRIELLLFFVEYLDNEEVICLVSE